MSRILKIIGKESVKAIADMPGNTASAQPVVDTTESYPQNLSRGFLVGSVKFYENNKTRAVTPSPDRSGILTVGQI
ncbi:MAG: hypothetical protein WBA74_11250 [Cyclobacteriaceae bacterium]